MGKRGPSFYPAWAHRAAWANGSAMRERETNVAKRKLLTVEIKSIDEANKTAEGKIGEVRTLTKADGTVILNKFDKELEVLDLLNPNDGEITSYWMNGGLRGAMSMGKVKPGMHVEIEWTGKKVLPDMDKPIDTYRIYQLEA
jgi:hypothetical protein